MNDAGSVLIWGPALGCLIICVGVLGGGFLSRIITGWHFRDKNHD